TSMRPGARFGPAGIRDASLLLRPWNPVQRVDVFGTLSVVDRGDVTVTPGNAERTTAQIAEQLEPLVRAGITTLTVGGARSTVLGELRAHAAVQGPLAVVLLDAHADTWEQYYGERYFHGTPFKRALEEGLIDPARSLLAGMRGSLYAASDLDEPRSWGFEIVPCEELRTWSPAQYAARVRERVGSRPAFMSFDIDVLDPALPPVRAAAWRAGVGGRAPARGVRVPGRAGGAGVPRVRLRGGRPAVRHAGAGDGPDGRQPRLRDAHAARAGSASSSARGMIRSS